MDKFDDFHIYEASLTEMSNIPEIVRKLVRMGLPERDALAVIRTPPGWMESVLVKKAEVRIKSKVSKRKGRSSNRGKSLTLEALLSGIEIEPTYFCLFSGICAYF